MRCDGSASWLELLRTYLTGTSGAEIDMDKITVSPSGHVQMREPPSKPPCVIANFGDELEDIGQRILALSRDEQAELARYVGEMLCTKNP
jgi:hypothetical protein